MYIPKSFEIKDPNIIYDLIEKYSFATLFTQHEGAPYATHLPMILNKDENTLYGHFARPNEQWKDTENQQVLVVFQGPHCYISPSWYETTKAVPTWNYVAVHVYGKMEILEESKVKFDSLNDLVGKYESSNSLYHLNEVESSFLEGMSKGIVAFKINVTKIEVKAKLSQNHTVERQKLIIEQLEKTSNEDNIQVAAIMRRNLLK